VVHQIFQFIKISTLKYAWFYSTCNAISGIHNRMKLKSDARQFRNPCYDTKYFLKD